MRTCGGCTTRSRAGATVAALTAVVERRVDLFATIVHTDHHLPAEVQRDFATHGPDWCETQVPGSAELLRRYALDLPTEVGQRDLSEAERLLGWVRGDRYQDAARDGRRSGPARGHPWFSCWACLGR